MEQQKKEQREKVLTNFGFVESGSTWTYANEDLKPAIPSGQYPISQAEVGTTDGDGALDDSTFNAIIININQLLAHLDHKKKADASIATVDQNLAVMFKDTPLEGKTQLTFDEMATLSAKQRRDLNQSLDQKSRLQKQSDNFQAMINNRVQWLTT